jgi:hypothetical protein
VKPPRTEKPAAYKPAPLPKKPTIPCTICGAQVRHDRLERHRKRVHTPTPPPRPDQSFILADHSEEDRDE